LYRSGCDLRRGFDRLACMVREALKEDPLSGDLYVFLNRRRTMLKGLYWDWDGYAIWHKRLERGRFEVPSGEGSRIDRAGLMHLLEGMKVDVIRRQRRYARP
jgi:transposase